MKNRRALRSLCCAGLVLPGVLALGGLVAHAASVTYTYDKAGRLKSAAYSDTSSTSYTLDPAGNRKSVTTAGPDPQAPSVPTGLAGSSPSCSQVNLVWNTTTDNPNPGGSGLAGYKVYRGGSQIGTPSSTSYADTGLMGSTTYNYSVAAYDLAGNTSSASGTVPITTAAAAAPTVPTGLTAAPVSNTRVDLSWSASSQSSCGQGVAGYKVYRGTSSGSLSLLTSTAGTTYSDTSAAANTTYWYSVASYDPLNATSAQSAAVSATTPGNYTDSSTMTAGGTTSGGWTGYTGYSNGTPVTAFGSMTSNALTGGKTIAGLYDINQAYSYIVVTGFASDPGASWLWSVTAAGVTQMGTSGTYTYSNGQAQWSFYAFGIVYGSSTAVTVVHK